MSELTSRMKHRIKRKLSGEKPTVWIGKNGVSPELLGEIGKQLDEREAVKIKILKTALKGEEPEQIASSTAEQTRGSLVEVRGHTFIVYRRRKK